MASFDESTHITQSQKLLNESSTPKEIDEFARTVTGLSSGNLRNMQRLNRGLTVMRSVLDNVLDASNKEIDRSL